MFKKSKSRDFFVSIGAGLNQIPLIYEAKKCGFQVIGVDQNASAPGFHHCDLRIQESINNCENIYIKLRELLVNGKISAIMTKSYGNAITTTSYLCERFGLPFIPHAESKFFLDKKIMRKKYKEAGIIIADEHKITATTKLENLKEPIFPFVVKPRTGHAKTEVKMLFSKSELSEFCSKNSPDNYIFEKFTKGKEIICAGLIHNNKYFHILTSDKITTPAPYFVDIMHLTPSVYSHLTDKIIKIGQKISEKFKIQTSPIIMEFIVDDENKLFLLEAVPEFGGEFIPDIMIPAATGYNFIGNTVKAAAGLKFKQPAKIPKIYPVATKYLTSKVGVLTSYNVNQVNKKKGIIFTRIFKDIGVNTKKAQTNHDRIGVIVAKGKTLSKAIKIAENGETLMNIRIKNEK